MIEVSHLYKIFTTQSGPVTVLDDVTFSVSGGEIFAVVGPSGAGKSTLTQCLNLLQRPTSGEVIVNGENLAHLDADALRAARRRIGTVFQSANLLSRRTAAENVALPLEYLGATKAAIRTRVGELLDRIGMADRADLYPHQLSGGQRQRVGIARALALKPAVLLSDEATSGLDPQATTSFLNLLGDVRDELGLAVVFITHEMDVITRIADRAGRLDHGHIAEQGAVADLVLDSDSVLGKALRPRGIAAPAGPGRSSVEVTYNSAAVPPDWIARVSSSIGSTVGVLGANIQSVDGVTAGALTVSVEDHSLEAFTAEAATYGITVGAGARSRKATV
ncbi:ATP-binding cassette domain-containing protein [Gordonia sp. L191]|uniref:methionine ABC transporter ATP-binding protein n=1 Tax=Gordonia sp. L191 TaxID=2982699 RepID=UPI0024C0B715|nr:ATP-binding cassette domain-containing protein [Gordonia sp. L191]WHU47097.1 ATP-binding cassette domain-containing protein [Gordonia sp. L191]